MRELVLRELVENVALVLVPVAPAQEPPAAALPVALDAGIVPGRDIVIPQQERPVEQRAELQNEIGSEARGGRV